LPAEESAKFATGLTRTISPELGLVLISFGCLSFYGALDYCLIKLLELEAGWAAGSGIFGHVAARKTL
jgi:hypothetical protein